jgi:hypothetical protein
MLVAIFDLSVAAKQLELTFLSPNSFSPIPANKTATTLSSEGQTKVYVSQGIATSDTQPSSNSLSSTSNEEHLG